MKNTDKSIIKQGIEERIRVWKHFYAEQTSEVDENSSWLDILLKLNLSYEESSRLARKAIGKCKTFNAMELRFLWKLPLYKWVSELMQTAPNDTYYDCFSDHYPNGDEIYFMRHPTLSEFKQSGNLYRVPIVVATIVPHIPVDFDKDVYVWCDDFGVFKKPWSKHLIIRYALEKPADYDENCNKQGFTISLL